jgi:uncharacterized protein HemY
MARVLISVGLLIAGLGVLIRIGVPIGRLPGDIAIRRGQTSFYFPIVTCLVLSVVVSLVAAFFRR